MSEASIIATLRDVKSELRSIINREPYHSPNLPEDDINAAPPVPPREVDSPGFTKSSSHATVGRTSVFGLKRTRKSHRHSASLRGRVLNSSGMYRSTHEGASYDYDIDVVQKENNLAHTSNEVLSERVYR